MLSRLYMQTMPQGVPEGETPSSHTTPTTRLRLIRNAGSWAFDPLSLSNDDLFETTCLIFDVLFTIDGASEDIGIQAHHLRPFLLAIRSVYSHDNTYHNYQHAVDVLQAMYVFLVDAGCIPPVSILESPRALVSPKWRRASAPLGTLKGILNNVDVFMLFIAAIGHDAGHPGLNNGFMVRLSHHLCAILFSCAQRNVQGHVFLPYSIIPQRWNECTVHCCYSLCEIMVLGTSFAVTTSYSALVTRNPFRETFEVLWWILSSRQT